MHPKLLFLALPMATCVSASAQTQLWVLQFGTGAFESAEALCPDGTGGAFVAGDTTGSLGGPNAGGGDAWLARYDSAGTRAWIRQFGTGNHDKALALCSDGAGGAFVAGETHASLGGPSGGIPDAWLARYDSAGNPLWISQLGSIATAAYALCPDGAGGAFVAGRTAGSLGAPNAGFDDAWLARYDRAGNQAWIRQWGTNTHDSVRALCPDGAGGVFAAGSTGGSLGGTNAGSSDAWLARYDSAGNQAWIRQFGGSVSDQAYALSADAAGGAFIGGYTTGSLGGTNAGEADAWLARYDSAGTQTWIRQWGTSAWDTALVLCSDGAGGAFVAGDTSGSLGAPSAGIYDAWLAQYDSAGQRAWIRQFGTSAGETPEALSPDGAGGAFVAGYTHGSLGGPNAGGTDAWLVRYGPPSCYPDCNADGQLTVADFGCFQTEFVAADPYADCNGDGQRTVADFGCFQTKFVTGCP